eukprot:TRINITY_DN29392_c0_g1_i1.p1 TRINITY_DN29392_c0_g1~~TRINITY_DN29392_c0_g1_i1.p1  ORF type:complete len:249 (-),score=64.06 TRINITY_DN29392_c0_g1_i1:249-995(-)
MSDNNKIDLYFWPTPNGYKVNILLEELDVPYELIPVDISSASEPQKEESFLRINPNGRIPAIVDHGNEDFVVFESGAIMIYLAEKFGKFLPTEINARTVVIQWVMFQMGGVGPMQGQMNHFVRAAPDRNEYAIKRYRDETRRLYEVVERRLRETKAYLGGSDVSIADFILFPWVIANRVWPQVEMSDLTSLNRWLDVILVRPAVQRAYDRGNRLPGYRPFFQKSIADLGLEASERLLRLSRPGTPVDY